MNINPIENLNMKNSNNLVWIDLEMTGLDPATDHIIEIATIVTDGELNIIAEGPELAIHQDQHILQQMDEWNQKHHGESGLIHRVQESSHHEQDVEAETLGFLMNYIGAGESPMCGNSICQDRRFLVNWMPELEAFFHYRNLDVSSIKELTRRWYPDVAKGLVKQGTHQALDDIRESIEELKYYRTHIFK
jgi:oligoribonuclease